MKTTYLVVLSVLILSCQSKPEAVQSTPAPTLPVARVTSRPEITYQDYPASIQGIINLEIRPQIDGVLDKIFVDEGAFVNAGQPIFRISQQPFIAALNSVLASQRAAESTLSNAQLEVDKLTPLVANKVIADYQLKSALSARETALANLEQTKANVLTARINLGYTTIKTPISGFVGRLLKKQGSLVGPADLAPLTDLSDVHQVHVYFALGERDFVNFKARYPGKTLHDKLRHLPEVRLLLTDDTEYPQKGRIDMIDGQFNTTTGAITMRASFPNKEGLLRSGNTGKLRLSMLHKNVMLVPQQATLEMQDKIYVYTVSSDNKVKMQPITLAGKSGENYLVKEGLRDGDRIVLSGFSTLQEGTLIKPETAPAKAIVAKN